MAACCSKHLEKLVNFSSSLSFADLDDPSPPSLRVSISCVYKTSHSQLFSNNLVYMPSSVISDNPILFYLLALMRICTSEWNNGKTKIAMAWVRAQRLTQGEVDKELYVLLLTLLHRFYFFGCA
jgi:hypothetical protein